MSRIRSRGNKATELELAKIEGNKKRDRMQNRLLRNNGWAVIRIWQHELTEKHLEKALRKLRGARLIA